MKKIKSKSFVKLFNVTNSIIKNQCYLIYNNEIGVLIDPAWEYSLINDFLETNKITLKAVLLTHAHYDHYNLAEKFSQKYEIPVFMSEIEINNYDLQISNLNKAYHLKKITLMGLEILPILTPGHTIGSMCYLIDHNLFTGDSIFIEGVGICDRQGAYKLFDSVNFLKTNLLLTTLFWPGHSYGETPGKNLEYLLSNNIYFNLNKAKMFVDFRTRKRQIHNTQ